MNSKGFGRPRVQLTRDVLINLYDKHQRWDKVANELGLSLSTVMRRVKEYNIRRIHTTLR